MFLVNLTLSIVHGVLAKGQIVPSMIINHIERVFRPSLQILYPLLQSLKFGLRVVQLLFKGLFGARVTDYLLHSLESVTSTLT